MSAAPALADIRERVTEARKVAEAPVLKRHGALDYLRSLRDVLALLDLYVGHEPTLVEENEYALSELVRLQEVEDRLRRLRLDAIGGTHPDPISRAVLVHQLTTALGDEPAVTS